MRFIIKIITLIFLLSLLSMAAIAQDNYWQKKSYLDAPHSGNMQPKYRYKGSSGMQYQYDLSRPGDRIKYNLDIGAKMRDRINPDPRINIDRGMGQFGGGAK